MVGNISFSEQFEKDKDKGEKNFGGVSFLHWL
jgi:hypothetical protein